MNTYERLLAKQVDPFIRGLKKEVLLSFIGLKLLKDLFAANRLEWNLVAGKGLAFIKRSLGGQLPLPLDQILAKIVFNAYP